MDWPTLEARIRRGDDHRTELGRLRAWNEKDWLKSVCALANTEGGIVVLGVTDEGELEGVPLDPEEVQERLTAQLQTALGRPICARLGALEVEGKWLHWIEVDRMRGPEPVTHRGQVLVRRGRASVPPETSELQELYNVFGLVLTEERVIPGSSVSHIDAEVFRSYMRRLGIALEATPEISLEQDLYNREVVAPDLDGAMRTTLFGLMCFGRSPQAFSPTQNLSVSLVAYDGDSRADSVISASEAKGRLDEQVLRSVDWLRSLGKRERYDGAERRDEWTVPLSAFRECVVNAVAHRDYAIIGSRVLVEVFRDRVVVTSPGALPNHKRVASVLAGGFPRSRNEAMANMLLTVGLMEQRGSGFPRIRREMQRFNGTSPLLENSVDERWVRVTLKR